MLNNNLSFDDARRRSRNNLIRDLAINSGIRVSSKAAQMLFNKKMGDKPVNFRKKRK